MENVVVHIGGFDAEEMRKTEKRVRELERATRRELEQMASEYIVDSEIPHLSKAELIFEIMDAEDYTF